MTRRWLVAVAVTGLAWACTRPNPAFEDDGQGSEAEAGSGVTSTAVGDASAEDGPEPTTSSVDGSSGDATTGDPGVDACSFPPRFGVSVGEVLEVAFGECGGVTTFGIFPQGPVNGGAIPVQGCVGGCGCNVASIVEAELVFEGPLPAALPECFNLEVQHRASDTGVSCHVLAYAILEGETPVVVASNVVDPTVTEPFGFELVGSPSPPCMSECIETPGSGYYALHSALGGGFDVPPNGTPVTSTSGPVTYDVVNLSSGINGACDGVGHWSAVEQPG